MTDTPPYRYLCHCLENLSALQDKNNRISWVAKIELSHLSPRLPFDEVASVFVPVMLRTIVEHHGDEGLRGLLQFLREDSTNGFGGLSDIVAVLNGYLTDPNQFTQLRAAIHAPPPADNLITAVAHFNTMPTNEVPLIQTLPSPHKMEIPPNQAFIGRENELKAVAQALKTTQVAAVVAAGIGGVGKTQLAVEWVHRYGQYFRGGVFWLDFSRPTDVPLEIATAGAIYNLAGYEGADLEGKVAAVKRKWAEPMPTLLIFDNCEEPEVAEQYLPITGGARILLTSRDQTWEEMVHGGIIQQIAIQTLPRDQSIALLRKFHRDLTDEVANGIAEAVGDLPLALHLAGSYLKAMRGTSLGNPATYLASLGNPDLLRELEAQLEWVQGTLPTRHEWSIAKTFALSMERMATGKQVDGELLRDLLLRVALFAPGLPIPLTWLSHQLTEGKGEAHVKRACTRLLKLGLLEEGGEGMVRMHRLVAQVVLANATEAERNNTERKSETIILEVKPTYGQADFVAQMETWLTHARTVAERALPRHDEPAALLASWVGFLIEKLGFYDQVQFFYEQALAISREVLGARHPDTASSLNNLAYLYESQGRYEAAEPLYGEALAIRREVLGARHPATATSLNNLAGLYESQGRYEAAEPLYGEALAIRREVLGARHPDTATSLNNLAVLRYYQGRYPESLTLLEESVSIRLERLGREHPDTQAGIRNYLAVQAIIEQQRKP